MLGLIEHFEGKFPTWFAPEQVRILPISEKFSAEADVIAKRLAKARVGCRWTTQVTKLVLKFACADGPIYLAVLGAREVEENSVSVRHRDRGDLGSLPTNDFVNQILKDISTRFFNGRMSSRSIKYEFVLPDFLPRLPEP